VAAFIVKEYQDHPSNFRSTSSLADYLQSQGVMGVEDLDTRALTRHIRKAGAMRAFLSTTVLDAEAAVAKARAIPGMAGLDLASGVTVDAPYRWVDDRPLPLNVEGGGAPPLDHTVWRMRGRKHSVVAIDYGIKYNILRCLAQAGFETVVVPAKTPADTIRAMAPSGIFLSNGPGDPEPVRYAIETIRALIDYRPMFGICLGHQLMGLALGGKTYKLKFGHRGANQPVKHLPTGRIEITSQNHGFAVDPDSLRDLDVEITHINLNDNTLEGFRSRRYPIYAVQYHPEASPGPHDARYLFDEFNRLMNEKAPLPAT
jgi:carbamoyl-phosphate synthase small subunit